MNLSSILTALSWADLLSWFLRMTLITAIGASVLALLRRASASTRHLVAMATLLSVVALPLASVLLPRVTLPILPARQPSITLAIPTSQWTQAVSTQSASVPELAPVAPAAPARLELSFPVLAILLSALVAAALLAHVLFSLIAAWSTVRQARRIDDPLLRDDLRAACERLGTPRDMDLRESSSLTVPVVWGFAHPVLLLPVEAREWTREQLRVVFLHEAAHVARRDWVSLLFARFTTSVFWFHPLVWMLAGTARQECERSCDDLVLASGERATEYAEHLLAIVRSLARPAGLAGMAPSFAQRSTLENRLAAILRAQQVRGSISRSRFVVTTLAAVLLLVGTAAVRVVAAQRPADLAADAAKCPNAEVRVIDTTAPPVDGDAAEGERWFRAGSKAFEAHRYVRAASSFLAAAEIGYRRPESLYHAARALAKAGATDDALTTLQDAVDAGFDHMDWMASDKSFDAIRSDPRFIALKNRKVALLTPSTKFESNLVKSIVVKPSMPRQIMVEPLMAQAGVARALMAQPVVVQPRSTWSVEVPRIYLSMGSWNHRHAKDDGDDGIELMRDGQYDRAIQAFNAEIQETGSSNARYNLACAYALKGSKAEAFDALQRAIENGFSDANHMTKDDDLKLLQDDPHFYSLVRLTQELQLFGNGHNGFNDKEDWQNSLPRFERVANEHPKVGRAWSNLGYARLQAGDPKGATDAYNRALSDGYQQSTTMYNLACCAARAGNREEAFQWLDKADKAGFDLGEQMSDDSDLDALRSDPRFAALLQRLDEKAAKDHREKEKSVEKEKSSSKDKS